MDTTEQLFIRACKSREPYKRVANVYRHFYLSYNIDNGAIAHILMDIAEKYIEIKLPRVLNRLNPNTFDLVPYNIDDDYWTKCVKILISEIRFSSVDKFPGLTIPAMFRKENS